MSKREKIIPLASLALLVTLLVFLSGFAFRHYHIWPTRDLLLLRQQIEFYRRFGHWGRENQFMKANVTSGAPRAVMKDASEVMPGYRAIMGFDVALDTYSVRLLDPAGEQVHVWPTSYRALSGDTEATHEINPHGMQMMPDGSIVVNFAKGGPLMARIDACGEPLWTREGVYHHSIDIDDDGALWTWFSPDTVSSPLQSILQMDAETGEHLREISMEEVQAASQRNAVMLALPDDYRLSPVREIRRGLEDDIFHPNDVEPLRREFAPAFPDFSPGDLLISLRELDLVAVLDPESLAFKWAAYGPWIRQHDPDFTASGRIEIYDNATGRGRSGIISVDPATGDIRRFHTPPDSAWYSPWQGKQQRLPSGAHLITVPTQGRVVEISEDGEIVFEFNNIAGDGVNASVFNAVWLPEDYYETMPNCARE